MSRRSLVAIVALSILISAGLSTSAASRQQASTSPVAIPFELATRHIVVNVTVNGSRPLSFVLDTGANAAIIRTDVARELGLSLYGTVNTGGAGAGTQTGSLVRDARWSLVGLDGFTQPLTLALPLRELPAGMGRDVDGIIGGEFIRQFVVEIDYQSLRLRLHQPSTFRYSGPGEAVPIEFTPDNHPVVTATVTPVDRQALERRFVLDVGASGALTLHHPFVVEQDLLAAQPDAVRAIGAAGAGGRTTGRIGRVASLRLGRFTLNNPVTMFSEDQAGAFANPALAGNIGAQIASRFRVFLDYGRRRLILEPAATFADPFDRAISGLALRALGADYRTFRVFEVLEQSAATDAGILEGDVVTAIDGAPAAGFTLSAIHELFEKPVTRQLTLLRAGQSLTVALTPRPLK